MSPFARAAVSAASPCPVGADPALARPWRAAAIAGDAGGASIAITTRVLGVRSDASAREIRRGVPAPRAPTSPRCQPATPTGPSGSPRLAHAYEILSDPAARARYDQNLHRPVPEPADVALAGRPADIPTRGPRAVTQRSPAPRTPPAHAHRRPRQADRAAGRAPVTATSSSCPTTGAPSSSAVQLQGKT